MTLLEHNSKQMPMISIIYRNELHLMREAFLDISEKDPDVVNAINERIAEIISAGEGRNMCKTINQQTKSNEINI